MRHLAAAQRTRKNTMMHVGGDYHSVMGGDIASRENIEYNLRHGVKHLTAAISKGPQAGWNADDLKRMQSNCEKHGAVLEAIRMDSDYIRLRPGAERDREIDIIAGNIRKAAAAGIRIITYNWEVVPYRRNGKTPGRGGTTSDSFKLEPNWRDLPLLDAGRVTHDDYWERITYFLKRIIPVAKENDVRMACHPSDPPGLPFGYQGVDQWDSPTIFESLKRYEAIVSSPYNGFQLDVGTTASGLKDPATEIMPIVRYLAERRKVHQVHLRNIRGHLNDFYEVFPDEGEMDFFQIVRILRDTQFSGAICPDHMPSHPGDPGGFQAFAFGYGYIKALIQAVNTEA